MFVPVQDTINQMKIYGMVPYAVIFVETIFAFLSVDCWVIPTGMDGSNSNKVIMLSS